MRKFEFAFLIPFDSFFFSLQSQQSSPPPPLFQTISKRMSPEGECKRNMDSLSNSSKRWGVQSIGGGSSGGVGGAGTSSSSSGRPRRQKTRKESKHYQVRVEEADQRRVGGEEGRAYIPNRCVFLMTLISRLLWFGFCVGVGYIGITLDILSE